MTKAQFKKRAKELKKEVAKLIDNRIEKVLNSGCLPLESYEDNYLLPKAFISACGNEIKNQFKPFSKKEKKDAKNIELFL